MPVAVVLGDGCVGKTSFVHKYISPQHFDQRYLPTLGVNIYNTTLPNGESIEIRDTAGIKQFLVNRDSFMYRNIDFAIIIFDITSKESWQSVDYYLDKLPQDVPVIICGNKSDEKKKISPVILNREYNLLKMEYKNVFSLVEISVKKNINLSIPFEKIICCMNTRSHSPTLF